MPFESFLKCSRLHTNWMDGYFCTSSYIHKRFSHRVTPGCLQCSRAWHWTLHSSPFKLKIKFRWETKKKNETQQMFVDAESMHVCMSSTVPIQTYASIRLKVWSCRQTFLIKWGKNKDVCAYGVVFRRAFCVECWHTDEHRLISPSTLSKVKRRVLFFASRSLSTPAASTAAADVPSIYSLNRKTNDASHISGK